MDLGENINLSEFENSETVESSDSVQIDSIPRNSNLIPNRAAVPTVNYSELANLLKNWLSSNKKECHNRDPHYLNYLFEPMQVTIKESPYAFSISALITKGSFGPKHFSRGQKMFGYFDLSRDLELLGNNSVVQYLTKVVYNNGRDTIMGRLLEVSLTFLHQNFKNSKREPLPNKTLNFKNSKPVYALFRVSQRETNLFTGIRTAVISCVSMSSDTASEHFDLNFSKYNFKPCHQVVSIILI